MTSHCLRSGFPVVGGGVNSTLTRSREVDASYSLRHRLPCSPRLLLQSRVLRRGEAAGCSSLRWKTSPWCTPVWAGKETRHAPRREGLRGTVSEHSCYAAMETSTSSATEAFVHLFSEPAQAVVAGLAMEGAARPALALLLTLTLTLSLALLGRWYRRPGGCSVHGI